MFKRLKKDRNTILLLFFIETLVAAGLIAALFFLQDIPFFDNYSLHLVTAYLLIVFMSNLFIINALLRRVEKYLNRTDITIASIFGNEVSPVFEFGNIVIFVYNEADEVIWLSQTTLLKKEDSLGQKIYDLIPDFDELTLLEETNEIFTSLNGKTFKLEINTGLKVVYLQDVSAEAIQNEKVEKERPFIGHIVIDNYRDLIVSYGEAEFVTYATQVKTAIMDYAQKYNLFLRSYGTDSYLVIGEESNYEQMKNDNFSLLEDVRKISQENDNPLTVSIGIGKGNTTSILRTSELSYAALNMALSRGGDQVAVYQFGSALQTFGAKNEVKQTRSHVRGRVLATSLYNLITATKYVLIMGHQKADFDALGSALGIYAICKSLKVKANIVLDESNLEFQARNAFRQEFKPSEITDMIITPTRALQLATDQTLVIVVDTQVPNKVEQPKLLEKCKDICVIDHHRKGESFISNPTFQYLEPQSSSASELVTELIYFQPNKMTINEKIANFLLAGIALDTKFFKSATSSKTFEMSMVLKNYQASVDTVSYYFKEEYETMILISGIVSTAKTLSPGIYIANGDNNDIITNAVISKVADEILASKDVQAVFVVGRTKADEVSISARSTTKFNVQLVIESLGGGGHFTSAGAQKKGLSVEKVCELVAEKVKIFVRDTGGIQ